ncbi:hypothetical protein HUO13_28670 [Saccharopolyspora erythraea]|uniref:WXG100 family type VII secretion target n=1 Tax=Saccharopolyspora erythraea TaxID=1836 RepID=UPI001BAC0F42|nr:DUF6883 domain-containing protein [Saccharopolyspora erythraea]QUH04235.1 hypothetical protein HUO13_28670 [Saccharopolyspora erythraea]
MTEPRRLAPPPDPGPSTPINVSPQDYYRVAQDFVQGQNRVQSVYDQLVDRLRGLSGAAGNDDPAQKFAESYTPAVRTLFEGLVRLHRLFGGIAQGLAQAGENHRRADADTVPGQAPGEPISLTPLTCPAATEPPPILGAGDTDVVASIADFVTPYYPNGHVDKMRDVSGAFDQAHTGLVDIGNHLHAKLLSLVGNNESEDLHALEDFWRRVAGTKDGTLLSALPQICHSLSAGCMDYASSVENTRNEIGDIVEQLALELVAAGVVTLIGSLLTTPAGGAAIAEAGGGAALSAAGARMAAAAGQLLITIGGATTIAAAVEAIGALSMAISNTPDPNVAQSQASSIGKSGSPSSTEGQAAVDSRKFSDYVFKEGADHGKDKVFRSLGYEKQHSEMLTREYEKQAMDKFARGEYTLGKADQYGQRIDIEIELQGVGDAAGKVSYLKSGWMKLPDGSIKLNTPFTGFTR